MAWKTAETRARLGKKETARIHVSCSQDDERLTLRIKDDGRGIDLESLVELAINKGLWSAEHAAKASNEQKIDLIFKI